MTVTAKVVVQSAVKQSEVMESEQVQLTFAADYADDRNKEWALYTPGLSLVMSVKPEVAEKFEVGQRFTLSFDPEEEEDGRED